MVRDFGLIELKHARSKFPSYGSCKPTRRTILSEIWGARLVCVAFQMRISVFLHFLVKFEIINEPVTKLWIAAEIWNLKYRKIDTYWTFCEVFRVLIWINIYVINYIKCLSYLVGRLRTLTLVRETSDSVRSLPPILKYIILTDTIPSKHAIQV